MIIEKILQQIESYYSEHIPDFSEVFEVLKADTESLVLKCRETDIKVVMNWKSMSDDFKDYPYLVKSLGNENEKYQTILNHVGNKQISESNPKIKFLEDCGFYSNGYGEYLFTYITWDINGRGLDDFLIGNVKVEVSTPSDLYKCLFEYFTDDDAFVDWESVNTIKVKNCCKDELEAVLQQALFIIAKYLPPEIEGDYPEIISFEFEGANGLWNEEPKRPETFDFQKSKHHEPLAFYNRARKFNDPLFYYKVLEYFFIINKKSEFQRLIEAYSIDTNIDLFMDSVRKIYGINEIELVENLLVNIDGITEFANKAFEDGLTNDREVTTFSKRIYEYRNGIVHGKKDNKFELNVPSILNQDSKNDSWIAIIRALAEKVIAQFCF